MDSIFSPVFLYGSLGFVVTWAIIPRIQKITLRRAEARNFQSHQAAPISRFGGISLVAALVMLLPFAAAFLGKGAIQRNEIVLVMGSVAMFGVGLLDDFRPIGARLKLLAQIMIASAVYFSGISISALTNPFTHETFYLGMASFPATIFWLVAMTNLINLVDGIDGLAGGISFMLMCLLAYTGATQANFCFLIAVLMAGALLGFVYYNFPPAKIYLGDGGAYFLGFLIGLLTIESSQKGTIAAALIAPIFALALPIMDVALAILRRGVKGLPIFRPDRRHIHHKLLASGLSRRHTLLTLYGVSLICLVMAFAVFWSQGKLLPILCGGMFLLLLLIARFFGLVKGWFSADKMLGTVMSMRKETRYALCLCQWIELEAERCKTTPELWNSYIFLISRIGIVRARLVLRNGEAIWRRDEGVDESALQHQRVEIEVGNITAVEFSAASSMSPKLFEHLVELALEAWIKSVLRWESSHRQTVQVDPSQTVGELAFLNRKTFS